MARRSQRPGGGGPRRKATFPDRSPARSLSFSPTAKKYLTYAGAAAVVLVVLSVGVNWFIAKTRVTDPERLERLREKICSIDALEGFAPDSGVDFMVQIVTLRQKAEAGENASSIMLIQVAKPVTEASLSAEYDSLMRQQDRIMSVEGRETRTVTIGGVPRPFSFAQATTRGDGTRVRSIRGVFPGRGGVAAISITIPEPQYNEASVLRILQSIRT